MLPEEQAENSRYFYELASARFGWSFDHLAKVQAFHFKGGQGAKTGTGGHLPGAKVVGRIAEVRGLPEGTPAVSPVPVPRLDDSLDDFKRFADQVRDVSGGIPVGFKLSAQHIEDDLDAALEVGVDYVILDGRGGGTGAAPLIFRDHITVPTMAALARARAHLDRLGRRDVTLVVTGGLRQAPDFAKALALGADAVAVSNVGHPGHRLSGHAGLPHRQLPGGHRHPEAAPAGPAAGRRGRRAARSLLPGVGRAHGGAGPGLRPLPPEPVRGVRPDQLPPGHGRPDRRRLRRRGPA